MKTATTLLYLAATLSLPTWAHAQGTQAASTTSANDLPSPDKEFVQAASMSSSTEIDASKLAEKQSDDNDVKSFAHHMMLDHTKLTLQLKMAAPHGIAVPKDNSDTAVLDSLKGLRGKAFDQAYIKGVGLEGHQKAVAAFQKEVDTGQNADLKKAAQKALPTIQDHLKMARSFEDGSSARCQEVGAVICKLRLQVSRANTKGPVFARRPSNIEPLRA